MYLENERVKIVTREIGTSLSERARINTNERERTNLLQDVRAHDRVLHSHQLRSVFYRRKKKKRDHYARNVCFVFVTLAIVVLTNWNLRIHTDDRTVDLKNCIKRFDNFHLIT